MQVEYHKVIIDGEIKFVVIYKSPQAKNEFDYEFEGYNQNCKKIKSIQNTPTNLTPTSYKAFNSLSVPMTDIEYIKLHLVTI